MAEISSDKFGPADLETAKIYFGTTDFAGAQLTQFPWLIFDVKQIPVLKKHKKAITVPVKLMTGLVPEPPKTVEVAKDEVYETHDDNWSFEHVLDSEWKDYFTMLERKFKMYGNGDLTEGIITSIVELFCQVFGRIES